MANACANPLYLQWIREWWDTANLNNAKDRLTYKRAWESMKANPVPFSHPSEAIKLTGIGPKLVERLTERLETHCREEGIPVPPRPTKKRARTTTVGMDDEDRELDAPQPKQTRKTPKGYVPKPRSGAYALLLTLAELPEGQTTGLTKVELQHQAQPLADASFTVPPDPSKFHTAWNSMGTLESKHLVYTFGKPTKRYALTEEGWAIAKSMKSMNNEDASASSNHVQTLPPLPVQLPNTQRHRIVIDIDTDEDDHARVLNNRSTPVDTLEQRIQRKFGSKEKFTAAMANSFISPNKSLDAESMALITEFAQELANRGSEASNHSSAQSSHPTNVSRPAIMRTSSAQTLERTSSTSSVSNLMTGGVANGKQPKPTNAGPSKTVPPFRAIIIPPGSFTVELVLDTREVRAKTDRNYIQEQLNKAGLRCEQRALAVGDMIWTARIHDQNIVDQLEPCDQLVPEVVLDYIAERKRLDDLDSSIKDKRFLEQKFRLKRSGIQNAIYIVEDYGSLQAMEEQQHTRLATAVAATQVLDGFFVKRTRKLDDTIAYLANMTRILKEKYEPKPLSVIPTSLLTPTNHFGLRATNSTSGDHHYITYEALAGLASKSATLTLRDIFLKMLMCTRGITGDKAMEVQKHWQTPRMLVEAFGAVPNYAQKNDMIWNIGGNLQGKRKIGKATSQLVASIWGSA